MDRTDALLARASQYLRAGTARPVPSPSRNENRQNAKSKAAEDEVEAYLRSLTGGGDEKALAKGANFGQKASASLPLPAASVALSGRGRAFLKNTVQPPPQQQPQRKESVEVPLSSKKEPIRSRSASSSSHSSPSPPISAVRRPIQAVVKRQSSEEADQIDDDDDEEAAIDQRLVAEHFRQALKTTAGGTIEQLPKQKSVPRDEPPPKQAATTSRRAPPLGHTHGHGSSPVISSSFVDESGNVIYSLTFESDEEATEEDEKSEQAVESEEDESPMKLMNVVQSVEELLSGSAILVETEFVEQPPPLATLVKPESRPGTANSVESVAESVQSRSASAASTESSSESRDAGRYSDDFDESSRSVDQNPKKPKSPPPPAMENTAPPVLNLLSSARSTEPQTITSTQPVEESVAVPLSESLTTDIESGRKRLSSFGASQNFLKIPLGKTKETTSFSKLAQESPPHEAPMPKVEHKEVPKPTLPPPQQQFPQFTPQQFFGGAPMVVMMPPQSFFQQYFASYQEKLPQSSAPAEARSLLSHHQEVSFEDHRKRPMIVQPSIYLPFFLERSNVRSLIAQCRILTESINATRIAYERRLENIHGSTLK